MTSISDRKGDIGDGVMGADELMAERWLAEKSASEDEEYARFCDEMIAECEKGVRHGLHI